MKELCKKCECPVNTHAASCPNISKDMLRDYLYGWIQECETWKKKRNKCNETIAMLHGKIRILKHENNKLRRKLRRY